MQNPTPEILEQGHKLLEAGNKMKDVQAATGLNYSQLWVYHTDRSLPDDQRLPATGEAVAKAIGEGNSWGLAAVRCGMTESAARLAYEAHTGLSSRGQRPAGKGGRRVVGLEDAYNGEAAKTGVKLLARSAKAKLAEKPIKDLRAIAKALGLPANGSKADLIERLSR